MLQQEFTLHPHPPVLHQVLKVMVHHLPVVIVVVLLQDVVEEVRLLQQEEELVVADAHQAVAEEVSVPVFDSVWRLEFL